MRTEAGFTPAKVTPASRRGLRRIWPPVLIVFGLMLTLAWILVLGYGLFKLTEMTFFGIASTQ